MTELVEELVEAGHWPALETLASLYGKLIWVTLDWGEDDAETVPPEQKKKIFDYAMRGLLSLNAFAEKKGRRIDAESAARIKSYGDEFKKYIEMTKRDEHWSFGDAR